MMAGKGSDLADDGSTAGKDPDTLIMGAQALGEVMAARALIERLAPRAFGQAMRWLADRAEAEDVVQEAMLRLWRQEPDWHHGGARVSTCL